MRAHRAHLLASRPSRRVVQLLSQGLEHEAAQISRSHCDDECGYPWLAGIGLND